MDILVMLEERPGHSPVLAHVNSVPSPLDSERPARDIVTLYGVPTPESLALALAAAVESHRGGGDGPGAEEKGEGEGAGTWGGSNGDGVAGAPAPEAGKAAIRHLGVWPERGAIGDAAWRDQGSGELVTRDLDIPLEMLHFTAGQLLDECGQLIHQLSAGLSMPDWPEGTRRALTVSLHPSFEPGYDRRSRLETVLERLREADGSTFEYEGD
ncbi:MAG: hypothetical protein ACRENI_00870 [Gemmatimonadaceae bacterium]